MPSDSDSTLGRLKAGLAALPPIERSVENGVLHETRAFRGITLEQALAYLENLGGKRTGASTIEGDGWEAHVSAETAPVGPSYRLTEVTVTWVGDRDVLESIIFRFRLKTFRAPG